MAKLKENATNLIKKIVGETVFGKIDKIVLDWAVGLTCDSDSNKEDIVESLTPLFIDLLRCDYTTAHQFALSIYTNLFKDQEKSETQAKLLDAPVMLARIAQKQEQQIMKNLAKDLEIKINYTPIASNINPQQQESKLEDPEALAVSLRNAKKLAKKDKKEAAKERKLAEDRDKLLQSLISCPVKIHTLGSNEPGRQRDIKLNSITMGLTNLELLSDCDVTIAFGRKYGLIGRNGIGKTTFLKHLAAHAFPGIPRHLQIVHIQQEVEVSDETVIQAVLKTDIERESLLQESKILGMVIENQSVDPVLLAKYPLASQGHDKIGTRQNEIFQRLQDIEADRAEADGASILSGLGFTVENLKQPTRVFSGGWRMRIALAQALFIQPDVLLLDEPTNHLDLHSVIWLEEYLKNWKKTLVVVSHDREFLNSISTDILHLYQHKIFRYKGNFDDFERQRFEALTQQSRAHEAQQKMITHMKQYVEKNRVRAATASMAQSRLKRLEKMVIIPEVLEDPSFQFNIPEVDPIDGYLVRLTDVAFGYSNESILYKDVSLSVDINSRVALVGPNGAGKSTLMKIMFGDLQPIEGLSERNTKVRFSRFTQHHMDQLDASKTPLQWFQGMYPTAKHQDIRRHLGTMGITGNLALQPIYSLSGGQKSRVAFANITWTKPHIIFLDEPTNHLDMETVDALIRALNEWSGGVLIISHDEHLITTVCNEIWICRDNTVSKYPGDFEQYRSSITRQPLRH
eukprot:TRINITY_DN1142_c0_g1_i1.p1 TRINITY_DN1142_c0_g1~~TRINITY_DN1142_c0_g1_i1.p1  ORF type:complete len:742 (+),score=320.78 TRINITY_DN1142_c0_g1_i1:69-2294(+)